MNFSSVLRVYYECFVAKNQYHGMLELASRLVSDLRSIGLKVLSFIFTLSSYFWHVLKS